MSDRLRTTWWVAAAMTAALATASAALWDRRMSLGVLAGGAWNLASLWCLTRLLTAWIGSRPANAEGRDQPQPSRRRVVIWLLFKFPLLYLVVFGILHSPSVSGVGFGVGFTLVLVVAVASLALQARRMSLVKSYGR